MNRKTKSNDDKSSIKSKPIRPNNVSKEKKSDQFKLIGIPIALFSALVITWYYNIYLSSLVNKPLNEPKIIDESSYNSPTNSDRYWGTYRSNLYFGLKTRSPNPFMVGMMWFNQFSNNFEIRHWCDQNDGLSKYGWIAHDGRNFGIHDIYENHRNGFWIRNSWVKRYGGKNGGDWTVRTRVSPFGNEENPSFVSILFYFGAEHINWIKSIKKSKMSGETDELGKFEIKIDTGNNDNLIINKLNGNISLVHLKESLIRNGFFERKKSKLANIKEYIGLRSDISSSLDDSNFAIYQISGFLPFEFDVIFESDSLRQENNGKELVELKGEEFDSVLGNWHGEFLVKFEDTFQLNSKNFSSTGIIMAQSTLSNLLGGIGFFSGESLVKSLYNQEKVLYWPANLYTAVPSRSFFPRGFLWDEGFHNILISKWDLEITKDIIGHWLDLMNIEGWIPREVILGDEARAKVPVEFWIQNNQFANPPTLFLPLYHVIHKVNQSINSNSGIKDAQNDMIYLNRVFKRLSHWYDWFNKTQIGKTPFTYRWRGRFSDSKLELNPKTLTSGLDDYPRASHPNEQERHLDLRCWMAWASKVMADLSDIIGNPSNSYRVHYETLKNNKILDELHWSSVQYADYGLHSDRIRLVRQKPVDEKQQTNQLPMIRSVEVEPTYQFVNSAGYVSLFPMLLELIDADSPKLAAVLDQIRDSKKLWTNFGLRSLARDAPLYDKRNTEHDPPYWRGAIWININYLALKSLKFYSSIDGPYREKAACIYSELRNNIINNMIKNYETTGYIWEQYHDITGRGQGSHPFTGWSSLVVAIMAEIY